MKNFWILSLVLIGLQGCANSPSHTETTTAETGKAAVTEHRVNELYEAHHKGRIYVFYNKKLYDEFKQMGHTPYQQMRIGAGPKGETIVFGLVDKDKKKISGLPSTDLFDGKQKASPNFYGEVHAEDRTYVFDSYQEMVSFRQTGEAAYRYTDFGGGANGETVVYVLRAEVKKKKPAALIEKFKAHNG